MYKLRALSGLISVSWQKEGGTGSRVPQTQDILLSLLILSILSILYNQALHNGVLISSTLLLVLSEVLYFEREFNSEYVDGAKYTSPFWSRFYIRLWIIRGPIVALF